MWTDAASRPADPNRDACAPSAAWSAALIETRVLLRDLFVEADADEESAPA